MLGDMLLELHEPEKALAEYDLALKMSPNRFNGLYNAGLAAELAGDKARAVGYYAALLRVTNNGTQSARGELRHVKEFAAGSLVPVQ
jgi:tetratricopeptide (TPR) repeat protein